MRVEKEIEVIDIWVRFKDGSSTWAMVDAPAMIAFTRQKKGEPLHVEITGGLLVLSTPEVLQT